MKALIAWLAQTRFLGDLEIPNISYWLVVIIIAFGGIFLVYYAMRFLIVKSALSRAIRKVRSCKTPLCAKDFADIDAYFRNEEILAASWSEFAETLKKPDPKTEPDAPVLNPQQAEDYINQRTIFAHSINMEFCSAVPGMLTALGLLGTFISIFVALSLLNLKNGEIREIQPFVNNLSGKFISSIFGIGSAFIFLVSEKAFVGMTNGACHVLQNELNAILTHCDSNSAMLEMSSQMTAMGAALASFKNELPLQLSTALETAVGKKVDELLLSTEKIGTLTEQSVKRRDESITKLVTSVVQTFRDTLAASAHDEIEKLTNGLGGAAKVVEQMNNELGKSLLQYEQAIDTQRVQIQKFIADQQGWTSSQTQQQQQQWEDFSKFYQQQVSGLTQMQSEQLETQMKAVQNSCEELLRSFERSSSLFQQKVNSNVETMLMRIECSSESQMKETKALVDYILSGVDSWTSGAQSGLVSVLKSTENSSAQVDKIAKTFDANLRSLNKTLSELNRIESSTAGNGTDILEACRLIKDSVSCMDAALLGVGQSYDEFARQLDAQSQLFKAQEQLWSRQSVLYETIDQKLQQSMEQRSSSQSEMISEPNSALPSQSKALSEIGSIHGAESGTKSEPASVRVSELGAKSEPESMHAPEPGAKSELQSVPLSESLPELDLESELKSVSGTEPEPCQA